MPSLPPGSAFVSNTPVPLGVSASTYTIQFSNGQRNYHVLSALIMTQCNTHIQYWCCVTSSLLKTIHKSVGLPAKAVHVRPTTRLSMSCDMDSTRTYTIHVTWHLLIHCTSLQYENNSSKLDGYLKARQKSDMWTMLNWMNYWIEFRNSKPLNMRF